MTVQMITDWIKGLAAAMQEFMLAFRDRKLLWPSIKSLFISVTAEKDRQHWTCGIGSGQEGAVLILRRAHNTFLCPFNLRLYI